MHMRWISLSAALLALTACAEKGPGPVLSTGERYSQTSGSAADYKLDVGDQVTITVYNEPSLTGPHTVAADGTISLPLIGDVPASGRTLDQVLGEARTRFANGYLRDPQVSGEVTTFRPFFIMGEVSAPGSYPYANGLTVMNAIALAKGFSPRANRDVVLIRRKGEAEEQNYRLTPELLVYPGDTVRIGERYF